MFDPQATSDHIRNKPTIVYQFDIPFIRLFVPPSALVPGVSPSLKPPNFSDERFCPRSPIPRSASEINDGGGIVPTKWCAGLNCGSCQNEGSDIGLGENCCMIRDRSSPFCIESTDPKDTKGARSKSDKSDAAGCELSRGPCSWVGSICPSPGQLRPTSREMCEIDDEMDEGMPLAEGIVGNIISLRPSSLVGMPIAGVGRDGNAKDRSREETEDEELREPWSRLPESTPLIPLHAVFRCFFTERHR